MESVEEVYKTYTKVSFASWWDIELGDYVVLHLNHQGLSPERISGFVEQDDEGRYLILGIALATLRYDWKTTEVWKAPVAQDPFERKLPTEPGIYLRNGQKVIRMRLQNTGEPMWERAEWITIDSAKVAEMEIKYKCGLQIQKLVIEEK
jgi:hypothetical protein